MSPEPSPSPLLDPRNDERSVRRSGTGELAATLLGRGQRIVHLDHARERATQAFDLFS
jgi:hypothetical protein